MPNIYHGAAVTGSGSSFRSTMTYTNGVYHLNERSIKKMDEDFKKKSYTNAAANLNNFSWVDANAIAIDTEGEGIINDYDFGAAIGERMGSLHEISDQRNIYQLQHVYSARETYERIYSDDRINERNLARVMKKLQEKLQVKVDKNRLLTWANGAANTYVPTSSGSPVALSTSNIVRTLLTANAMLDNMDVPESGRLAFISITDSIEMQLADELKYQQEFTNKGAVNGAIRKLGRTTVVAVPDNRMPAGCKVLLKWKGASADPNKMNYTKIFPEKEGHDAPLLNAIWRFDSFVLAHKANGILVIGDSTAAPQAAPTAAASTSSGANKITFTSSNATGIIYTIDGHNPKIDGNGTSINLTATSGTAVSAPDHDCYIQAYAYKTGIVNSGIAKWFYNSTSNTLTALAYDENVPI